MSKITFKDAIHNRRFLQALDLLEAGENPYAKEDPNETISSFDQENMYDDLVKEKAFDVIHALIDKGFIEMDVFETGFKGIIKSVINHLDESEDALLFLESFLAKLENIEEEYDDDTLLSWAIYKNKGIPTLKAIINAGCAIDCVDRADNSILHQIVSNKKDAKLLSFFIEEGLAVDGTNILGETALHLAAKNRDEDYIAVLLEQGADPNLLDTDQKSPYYYALVLQRSFEIYELFAEYASPDFDQYTLKGGTLLFDFISYIDSTTSDIKIIEKMLEDGADLNQEVSDPYGEKMTPIDLVAKKNYEPLERILNLDRIDINRQDKNGNTLLHKVCAQNLNFEQENAREMYRKVKLLLNKDADVTIKNDQDQTPMMLASDDNLKAKIVTLLLNHEN